VTSNLVKFVALSTLAAFAASCGEFTRQGQSPALIVIRSLEVASGATPSQLGGTLNSDVVIMVTTSPCSVEFPCATLVNDVGEVTMSLLLKDPGVPGLAANPSFLNSVTINRYRVEYVRSDGRNVPGVDVPYPFDSALTFTIPNDGSATAGFQIVRHTAKVEAPLKTLATNGNIISTIAYVTFYGRDQAGNDISAVGSVGIDFGDFADPD
jgi:hypothetical protein